jgi:hypothetical protein
MFNLTHDVPVFGVGPVGCERNFHIKKYYYTKYVPLPPTLPPLTILHCGVEVVDLTNWRTIVAQLKQLFNFFAKTAMNDYYHGNRQYGRAIIYCTTFEQASYFHQQVSVNDHSNAFLLPDVIDGRHAVLR